MTKLLLPPVSGLLTQPMDEDESQHWISPGLFCSLSLSIYMHSYIYFHVCMSTSYPVQVNFDLLAGETRFKNMSFETTKNPEG